MNNSSILLPSDQHDAPNLTTLFNQRLNKDQLDLAASFLEEDEQLLSNKLDSLINGDLYDFLRSFDFATGWQDYMDPSFAVQMQTLAITVKENLQFIKNLVKYPGGIEVKFDKAKPYANTENWQGLLPAHTYTNENFGNAGVFIIDADQATMINATALPSREWAMAFNTMIDELTIRLQNHDKFQTNGQWDSTISLLKSYAQLLIHLYPDQLNP